MANEWHTIEPMRAKINPRRGRVEARDDKQLWVDAMFNPANGYGDLARAFCTNADKRLKLGIAPNGDWTDSFPD